MKPPLHFEFFVMTSMAAASQPQTEAGRSIPAAAKRRLASGEA
jgi:hypothetical protein